MEKLNDSNWIKIDDRFVEGLILEALADSDKKSILDAVIDRSRMISDILNICKIPQSSGYGKIKSLIEGGLLIRDGSINTQNGKSESKYRSMFQNVRIIIERNSILVEIQLTNELLERLDRVSKFEYVRLKSRLQENCLERITQ